MASLMYFDVNTGNLIYQFSSEKGEVIYSPTGQISATFKASDFNMPGCTTTANVEVQESNLQNTFLA